MGGVRAQGSVSFLWLEKEDGIWIPVRRFPRASRVRSWCQPLAEVRDLVSAFKMGGEGHERISSRLKKRTGSLSFRALRAGAVKSFYSMVSRPHCKEDLENLTDVTGSARLLKVSPFCVN